MEESLLLNEIAAAIGRSPRFLRVLREGDDTLRKSVGRARVSWSLRRSKALVTDMPITCLRAQFREGK